MSVKLEERGKTGTSPQLRGVQATVRLRFRKLLDNWAKRVVTGSGFAIIASILAILIFIVIEVWPLFESAKVKEGNRFSVAKIFQTSSGRAPEVVTGGVDENQEIGYLISKTGVVQFFSLQDGSELERFQLDEMSKGSITSVWRSILGTSLAFGTSQGRLIMADVAFNPSFYEGKRSYRPSVSVKYAATLDSLKTPLSTITLYGDPNDNLTVAAITRDHRVLVYSRKTEESFLGEAQVDSAFFEVRRIWTGRPTTIVLDGSGQNLYLGSDDGKIYHYTVSDAGPHFVSSARVTEQSDQSITSMAFLIGLRTLVIGDSQGKISAWFLVRDSTSTSGWRLTRVHEMASEPAAVRFIAPSPRRRDFIAGDTEGNLSLQFTTSERLLARFHIEAPSAIRLIDFAPKANGAVTLDSDGYLTHWLINNPHPEAGIKAFFGKVWYEGYEKPEYVWQSTGGSDEFEPKLSLVPLIFGSLKGTFYALIFAIPLAIFGAMYTSQFMHPTLRNYVKPAVELMAALPSVVLGFLAGLWLAPKIEDKIPAILLMFFVLPILILLCTIVWRSLPRHIRNRFHAGTESLLLLPVIVFGIWMCLQLNEPLKLAFFGGNFRVWLFHNLNISYDQRNALVVGIAMGFAVIPIIYTISEDAMSNVPRHLISGSLALGATPWQTAVKVVLPTAAAGIFSAIMIGLGRAVGETMIVLMATGNTPIMDWNLFNGFRTLSANIAVEVPEAPVAGTLYRVLFLSALLLFVITFLVNTVAEVVRQRLRTKYQKL